MKLPFHEDASPKIFENARSLKQVMTPAEKLLWQNLRNRKIGHYKFRRQHPIAKYIVDFYCHEAKLVVEVDGKIHLVDDNPSYDQFRSGELENMGLKVIRVSNEEVLENVSSVLAKIRMYLTPGLSPGRRGEK